MPKTWRLANSTSEYVTNVKQGQKLMGWTVEQPSVGRWFAAAVVYTDPIPWGQSAGTMTLLGRRSERIIPGPFDSFQHALDAIVAEHVTHKME